MDKFKDLSMADFISYLLELNDVELTLLATIIGYYLSIDIDYNKQNSLGNFFELIGQILLTIAAQSSSMNNVLSTNTLQKEIEALKKEIEELRRMIH